MSLGYEILDCFVRAASAGREGVDAVFPDGYVVEGKAPDTVDVRRRRERRRAAKMAADPEYLERRRAQARASYHRNKHKHKHKRKAGP